MRKPDKIIRDVMMVLLAVSASAGAVPTVGTEPFNTINGWQNGPGVFGGATNVSVGSIGGETAVQIMFGAQGFPAPEDAQVYATAASSGGNFVGDYANSVIGSTGGARFDFYAANYTTPSNTVSFFFHSTNGSGRTWQYWLSGPATVGAWYTYDIPWAWDAARWSAPGDPGQAVFLADLQFVDQLGVLVVRSANTGAQTYGLDDMTLYVPEPSTYAILAFTLLTLGLTLRRKRLTSVRLTLR